MSLSSMPLAWWDISNENATNSETRDTFSYQKRFCTYTNAVFQLIAKFCAHEMNLKQTHWSPRRISELCRSGNICLWTESYSLLYPLYTCSVCQIRLTIFFLIPAPAPESRLSFSIPRPWEQWWQQGQLAGCFGALRFATKILSTVMTISRDTPCSIHATSGEFHRWA